MTMETWCLDNALLPSTMQIQPAAQWVGQFEPQTERFQQLLRKSLGYFPDALGFVAFECVDLSSALCGRKFATVFGSARTLNAAAWQQMLQTQGRCPLQPAEGRGWQYSACGVVLREPLAAYLAAQETGSNAQKPRRADS